MLYSAIMPQEDETISVFYCCVRSSGLHHRRLLVHLVNIICQPAVTLARAASDTFAGIRLIDVPGFIAAQIAGAFVATRLFRWLASGSAS